MKNYFIYWASTRIKKIGKIGLKYLPLLLSVIAIFISYKSYMVSQTDRKNKKKPSWSHQIDLIDSTFLFQKISFYETKPELTLRNVEIILPKEFKSINSNYIFKKDWNCVSFQIDILDNYSHLLCPPKTVSFTPISASDLAPHKIPLAVKFYYLDDNNIKEMFCYYELSFRYFPTGKLKIYSLNYIDELDCDREEDIQKLIDYKANTDGFYNVDFACSDEVCSTVSGSEFSDLFDYLHALKTEGTGDLVISPLNTKTNQNNFESLVINDENIVSPYIIQDQSILKEVQHYFDSVYSRITKKSKYKNLGINLTRLRKWLTDENFSFFYASKSNLDSCVLNSRWSLESNFREWSLLVDETKLEIWKLYYPEPKCQ